jgi:hypothetical protein
MTGYESASSIQDHDSNLGSSPRDHERVGGVGLLLVNELSEGWGVARDGIEGTRVWCDILLDRSGSSELRAVDSE